MNKVAKSIKSHFSTSIHFAIIDYNEVSSIFNGFVSVYYSMRASENFREHSIMAFASEPSLNVNKRMDIFKKGLSKC